MDFTTGQLSGLSGSAIATLLEDEPNGFDGLNKSYVMSTYLDAYQNFLHKLEERHGKDKLITKPTTCPLYSLHLAAKAYLKSQYHEHQADERDPNLKEIKEKLKSFKRARSHSHELSDEFVKFLNEINVTRPVTSRIGESSQLSSSAGAAAGGVLGTAALGGTAAALATNVGGITTTLKNFIPIFK
ncbi:fatty acid amide hydrolase 1 [Babesia caballi]|uniref:Fatty acid amide hydrolase 1 n=1 Tax=Babesia caballi TaxID=5871 RepID=A0AAV4LY78_BABCB|nr:fatty acid amide hydrolase 1 [Babesia caballi]